MVCVDFAPQILICRVQFLYIKVQVSCTEEKAVLIEVPHSPVCWLSRWINKQAMFLSWSPLPRRFACRPFFFFWSLYWTRYNIASVLRSGFLAERHVWSYLPDQESNPRPGRKSLNRWSTREVLASILTLFLGSILKADSPRLTENEQSKADG